MIKTVNGKDIEYQTLEQKLENAVNSEALMENPVRIECSRQEKNLAVIIEHQEKKAPDSEVIVSIINQVIAQEQIIDEVLIYLADSPENLYSNTPNQLIKGNESGLEIESISNNNDHQVTSNTSQDSAKKYQSRNFSVGFICFVLGLIVISISGLVYYFTRPCVVGECLLIPETKTKLDNVLKSINAETSAYRLTQIQATISESSQELTRIPSWSKYYDSAQKLRQQSQLKNRDIGQILSAFKLEDNAKNMTQNLPLSQEEWLRVKGFWQEAIALLQANQDKNFNSLVNTKLNAYRNEIETVEGRIEKEKQGEKLLAEAQKLATIAEQKQQETIDSVMTLETIEKDWISAVSKVEKLPVATIAYQKKDQLLNNYLSQLSVIQEKIRLEKLAINVLDKTKNKVNLAKKSQEENQWTKAVAYWQKAIKLLENYPENSFLTNHFQQLQKEIKAEIPKAKEQLKLAITRENIRGDLKKICAGNEPICNYSVTNDLIKVYLTDKYMENVAKISSHSNFEQQQQLEDHINQVEKNYQFISSKYQKPLEVYNPQKKLIIKY